MQLKLRYLVFACGIISMQLLHAQKQELIDSLEHALSREQSDTQRVNICNKLADQYRFSDPGKHLEYAKTALSLARKTNFRSGLANAYNMVGMAMENSARFDAALDYYDSSLTTWKGLKNDQKVAQLHLNKANVFLDKGAYKSASSEALTSLRMQESQHNLYGVAVANLTLGNIYFTEGDPRAALNYYEITYRLNKASQKNPGLEAAALGNIGGMFLQLHQYDSSLYYYRVSLHNYLSSGADSKLGTTYNNIGTVFLSLEKYDSALFYQRLALHYDYKMENPYAAAHALLTIGNIYQDMGRYDSSAYYYHRALELSKKIKTAQGESLIYYEMSHTYELKGDLRSAIDYLRKYIDLNDSLTKAEQTSTVDQLKNVYELDRKDHLLKMAEAENKLNEQKKKISDEKNRRNTILFISLSVIGLLVSGVLLFLYRTKRKHNIELEQKNREIMQQKEEITSSIHYAKRIQEAIFPSKEVKYRLFPDAFVMLVPRDIVSGDFYWFAEKNGKKLIAAVDCTGHGVPGAFMSMIGNAFLNEIVNEKGNTDAGKILDELRDMVVSSLKQTGQDEDSKDGMDIALVVMDEKNGSIQYAGANNPIWICRKNSMEMEEIKADKQPIGFYSGERRSFTGHTIRMSKGDSFYIFTDGFADQFGGKDARQPKRGPGVGGQGKKFRYKPLKELFINVNAEPMQTQEKILRDTFSKWKGDLEQVDDVLVIGVRC